MWWPFAWLGLGFILKWIKEAWDAFKGCLFSIFSKVRAAWTEGKIYDYYFLLLSFALIYGLYSYLQVGAGVAFTVLLFWLLAIVITKVK